MVVNGHLPRLQRKWYQFMLDIAWPELMVIGIVAVVAIGPKDMPKVMHTLGRWAGKARHMAQDVQRSFEQLSYETEVAERMSKNPPPHAAETKPQDAPMRPTADQKPEPHDHLGSA